VRIFRLTVSVVVAASVLVILPIASAVSTLNWHFGSEGGLVRSALK